MGLNCLEGNPGLALFNPIAADHEITRRLYQDLPRFCAQRYLDIEYFIQFLGTNGFANVAVHTGRETALAIFFQRMGGKSYYG